MRRLSPFLIALTAAFLACSESKPDVEIAVVDQAALRAAIQNARGDLLVVNFWATWCEPCVEEMPRFERLVKEHGDEGLRVLAVSVDETGDLETRVRPFVESRGFPFTFFLKADMNGEAYEAFVNSFDSEWLGGVPATFVFDREGTRRASFEGELTYDEMNAAVEPYL